MGCLDFGLHLPPVDFDVFQRGVGVMRPYQVGHVTNLEYVCSGGICSSLVGVNCGCWLTVDIGSRFLSSCQYQSWYPEIIELGN